MSKPKIEDALIDILAMVETCEEHLPEKQGVDKVFYMAAAYSAIKHRLERGVKANG